MKIEININENDYQEYAQKAKEIGIDPSVAILAIINQALLEKKLRAKLSKIQNSELTQKVEKNLPLFDLEKKIKKHGISQSAIASYMNSTQSTISRAFKSPKNNTPLALKYQKMGDKLLAYAYIQQQISDNQLFYLPEYSELKCITIPIPEDAELLLSAVAATVQKNLSHTFNIDKFEQLLCDFIYSKLFRNLNFQEMYQDIDIFVDTVIEIVDNYFYKGRL